MPAQQESWIATAYLSGATGPLSAGTVLCLDAAGDRFIPSTSANRTATGRRSACIALTGGDDDNIAVEGQYVGVIPPSISGLAAGSVSLVRVSTAGVLERVGSYSTSDDVVGHCEADGTAYVCFPLVGLGAALGASSAPGLPANSIQYYLNPSALGGAAHANISSDGNIETRAASEAVAATGHWRTGYNVGTLIGAKDSAGTDRSLLSSIGPAGWFLGTTGANLTIGTIQGQSIVINGNSVGVDIRFGNVSKIILNSTSVTTAFPRLGMSTAWGGSEGEISVGSTGTYSLTVFEHPLASWLFTGAGTGTYTIPAPTNSTYSYFKWAEEKAGFDRIITIGSGTSYTLKANTSVWLKVTANGVFAQTFATGYRANAEQIVDITGGSLSVDLSNGKILKVIGTNAGTPVITITPQPTAESISDNFIVRFTSGSGGATITTALGGKTTVTQPAGSIGQWMSTPDGIKGYYVTSGGSIVGFSV